MRAVSAYGLPVPQVAPAVVFDTVTNRFIGIVASVQNSSAFLYDPDNGRLYSADYANNTVGVINPVNGVWVSHSIPVGSKPDALALNASSNVVYVANFGSNNITIINATKNSVSDPNVPTGPSPCGLALDTKDHTLFVADEGNQSVSTVNTTTDRSGSFVQLPGNPSRVAYSAEGGTLAVTVPSTDSVILVETNTLTEKYYPNVGTGAGPIVASTNGTEYVVGNSSASGSDVVVFNSTNGAPIGTRIQVGASVTALVAEPDGQTLLTWSSVTRNVSEVDLVTRLRTGTSPTLGPEPESVAYDPGTNRIFMADAFDGSVIVLNATTGATIPFHPILSSAALSVAVYTGTDVLYVGLEGGVVAVDPDSGAVIASSTSLPGGNNPVIVDAADGFLWVANGQNGLEALNLSNLQPKHVVGIPTGFVSQDTIALDSAAHELFVVNETSGVVEEVNSVTGTIVSPAIAAGANAKVVAYDDADDSLYVAGTNLTILDPMTGAAVGAPIPLVTHNVTTGIAYDASRNYLYVTTTLGSPTYAGTVSVIEGSTRAASYGSVVTIPVGELATSPTPFFLSGGAPPTSSVVWVPNIQSGTVSVIESPPEITFFTASPSAVDVGQSVQILLGYAGGAGPDTIVYTGLPTGCRSADQSTLECSPLVDGNFTINATITDAFGISTNATTHLTVAPGLTLGVVLTPGPSPALDVGEILAGVANATGGTPIYSYAWSFGDGGSATGPKATHTYDSPGTYLLQVSVTDSVRDTVTDSQVIQVNAAPTVSVSVSPTNVTDVDVALRFSATVSGGSSPGVATWNFTSSVDRNVPANGSVYSVTHAWGTPGVYSALFTFVDAANVSIQHSVSVTVEPALAATFSANTSIPGETPLVGTVIDFRAVPSGGVSPYSVSWSFGDGSYGNGLSPTHAYAQPGDYKVKVNLTDAAGVRVNETLPIVVGAGSVSSSTGTSSPSFGVSLFLGLLIGAAVAVVVLYAVGRSKRRNPPPPHPYVPPEGPG
jgi:YVTN family beta-propeller protein